MITDDIEIVEEIFSLIDAGIVHGYDSFRYEVEVHEGYTEEELTVENNKNEVTNAVTDFNGAILYELVNQLKNNFSARGESWVSFIMSYQQGGEVKTKFKY